jgi:hypothetical protein
VILDVPRAEIVVKELERRNILVDYRPGAGVRVGPHFYNTDEEVDQLVASIREIAAALSTRRESHPAILCVSGSQLFSAGSSENLPFITSSSRNPRPVEVFEQRDGVFPRQTREILECGHVDPGTTVTFELL